MALLLAHKGLSQRNSVTIYVDGQRDIFLIFKQGLAITEIIKLESLTLTLKITSAKPKNAPSVRNNFKPTVLLVENGYLTMAKNMPEFNGLNSAMHYGRIR